MSIDISNLPKPSASMRDQLSEYLKTLPKDVSIQEIMYHLHVRTQILEAQEEIRNGRFYTNEQAKDMLKKWLQ
jgi:hypothetical protein